MITHNQPVFTHPYYFFGMDLFMDNVYDETSLNFMFVSLHYLK